MYKIKEISILTGVTTRALRYYDKIGLLEPTYIGENNYRYYSEQDIDTLQQILFYKELEFSLDQIKTIIKSNNFNYMDALLKHKERLLQKKKHLDLLINTINQTIKKEKGEITMNNEEKFIGLKEELIKENESKFGKEVRDLYGDDAINSSYDKMRKMSKWEFNEAKRLGEEINRKLNIALTQKDPNSKLAQEMCSLHQKWIKMYWTTYSKESHLSLVKMYTQDERFKAYYEKQGEGATEFLYDAMQHYLKKSLK